VKLVQPVQEVKLAQQELLELREIPVQLVRQEQLVLREVVVAVQFSL